MPGELKKKAKKKAFDPRVAFGAPAKSVLKSIDTIGPQEQTIKLDPNVKGRGTGKMGVTIGARPKKSISRGRSIIAGRSQRGGR